jgi:hypothetical protein
LRKQPEVIAAPAKTELFSRNNRRRLDSVAAITRELGKIYRAATSGTIESGEAIKLSMILRELRNAMEAQTEAATLNMPASPVNFTILSVPPGTQVDPNDPTKFIWPADGTRATPEFKPFEGTPDWTRLPPPPEPTVMNAETSAPIEVVDDGKVVRLDPWRDRDGPSEALRLSPPGVATVQPGRPIPPGGAA